MRRRTLLPLVILLFMNTGISFSQNDSLKKQAYKYAIQGMELVDKNRLDDAIDVFQKGFKLDPENSLFQYEIAVIYYIKKEYAKTISILEKYIDKPDANDQFYQILGNAYDLSGQTAKAQKIYTAGLKRFPSSAVIHLEAGILEYMHGNNPDALRYWEAGVIAQPEYAANYYWLAKTYAATTEKIWAVLYGEIFINLDRNSDKTQEISKLLYDIYRICLPEHKDSAEKVNFTKSITVNPGKGAMVPFVQVFQNTMQQAADSIFAEGADTIGIDQLCRIRELFTVCWFRGDLAANYPNLLFDRFKQLKELNYFDSYNRWIFLKGNESTFETWYYTHTDHYNAFVNWFKKNPVKINKEKYFSRSLL